MSVRRALVDCVVLSLQHACVFYPCCMGCFSRIDVEQQETTRCRCSKCGYSCSREQVEYRYRLSLRVVRDGCMFGVTVFGTCLNQFFGIHASGLQRLVENLDGPVGASTRSILLLKAVKDCFIGRRFIFGIKLTGTDTVPWLGGPVNGSSSKDAVQFIASQMILPSASGLGGFTVVRYYQILLQKAEEIELGSPDSSKISGLPAAPLMLIPRPSPASSFNNATLWACRLLPQPLQRSQNQDCPLSPTPPWQQSLGLVTSSAEQEEGYSAQDSGDEDSGDEDSGDEDSGDEDSKQIHNNKTPHHVKRCCWDDRKDTEETELSPVFLKDNTSYNHPLFAESSNTSIDQAVANCPMLNTCLSPSSPSHDSSKAKRFSSKRSSETFLPSSLVWEDLPFSESLSEFLCEENKDFDIVVEREPHNNVQNQKERTRNNLEIIRQDKNLSVRSTSVCQSEAEVTDGHSRTLMDITNTPALKGGGRSNSPDWVCENPTECGNKSQVRRIDSHECGDQAEKDNLLSFEDVEEEQLEGETYNCSADLFSSPLVINMSTNTLNTHTETVRTTTEACSVLSTLDKQHLRGEKANVPHLTPEKQKLKSNKCLKKDSLFSPGSQNLDFIPPSQSTPIVKAAVVCRSRIMTLGESSLQPDIQDLSSFYRNLSESDRKMPAKITSCVCKLDCVSANQLCQCGKQNPMWKTTSSRQSERFTPKRGFWKPDKLKKHVLTQQTLRVWGRALNTSSIERIDHKCDSSNCDLTLCDFKDSEAVFVPPTPAVKMRQCVKSRRRKQTDDSSSDWGFTCEGQQEDGINGKRILLNPTLISSLRGLAHTGNCDSKTENDRSLDGSNCCVLDDDNEACDWSRDLFSDSV